MPVSILKDVRDCSAPSQSEQPHFITPTTHTLSGDTSRSNLAADIQNIRYCSTRPPPANKIMEDLEVPGGSPVQQNPPEPEGNNDAGDILKPEIEEEHTRTPPLAEPTDDLDAHDEAPEAGDDDDDAEPNNDGDSDLDELDEAQFDNFDPESATVNVPDQPVAVDDSNVALLGVHKRKRVEGEDGERKKKKKEGRREKAKKVRAGGDDDEDNFEGGPQIEGSRRKKAGAASKRAPRARSPENEDNLSPEERKSAVRGNLQNGSLTCYFRTPPCARTQDG